MYVRRIWSNSEKWKHVVHQGKCYCSSNYWEYSSYSTLIYRQTIGKHSSNYSLIRRSVPGCFFSSGFTSERWLTNLDSRSDVHWRTSQLRYYSSEGDERNRSEDKYAAAKDGNDPKIGEVVKDKNGDMRHCDAHAQLGWQDQKEWLNNEKLAIESKKKESPFLSRRERFKNGFLRCIVPWEKITVSWDTFPYYIQ